MTRFRYPNDPATTYARSVVAGKVVAGKYHLLAAQRHLEDLKRAQKRSKSFPYWYDHAHAKNVVGIFPVLFCHSKGEWGHRSWCADCRHHAEEHLKGYCSHKGCDCDELEQLVGQPFELSPFQQFIVGSLFGWKRAKIDVRRFQKAYVALARKNGKSPLASAIALFTTFCEGEQGAEGFCFATTREQSAIVWKEAARMVRASPSLNDMLLVRPENFEDAMRGPYKISMSSTGSSLEPLGADQDTADGKNMHFGVIDELHAHSKPDLIRVVENSTSARLQPLVFMITYAGTDETTICAKYDDAIQRILERKDQDEEWFGFIARPDDEDDWRDEQCWQKANPMLGVTPKVEALRTHAVKAKNIPAEENDFKRAKLNMWVQQEVKWLSIYHWDKAEPRVPLEDHFGDEGFAAFDIGETRDLTALDLVFERDGGFDCYSWFWAAKDSISQRAERERRRFQFWVDEGLIETTEGYAVKHEVLRDRFAEILAPFSILAFPYDPRQATWLANQLSELDYEMIVFPQNYQRYTEPTQKFEDLVVTHKFRHGGNKVLRWMAGNVVKVQKKSDPKQCMPGRGSDRTKKIDGIVAGIMTVDAWIRHQGEEDDGTSIYESRDPVVLGGA